MTRRHKVFFVFLVIWAVAAYFSRGSTYPSPANNPPQPTFPPPVSKFTTSLPTSQNLPLPPISAKNIFIIDRGSKMVLYSQNGDDRIYPASTTKMMTALVAADHYPWDTELTVSHSFTEGTDIGLRPGERVTVENLLYALLVQSANDAAEVLADNYDGGRESFINSMNQWAERLNLQQTHFLNPTGLDQEGHYSSASDLARLADYLVENPGLRRIVSTENAVIASVDLADIHPVTNVNRLLGKVPGVFGVKTGYTDLAGESLVTFINRDGHEVIISLMGSLDRFADTTQLIDWVYSNYKWK
jgi:D-alanyl-D-alanine carboxypeptidase (penicillin-binding protein 5/6)